MTKDMNDIACVLGLILFLGLILIFIGKPIAEGFAANSDTIPCGVDKGPCPGSLKCINGFCAKTAPADAWMNAPSIPMLPDGLAYPYF